MEVIRLSGYTELEKLEIAKRFLVRKQMEATGLSDEQIEFTDDRAQRPDPVLHAAKPACATWSGKSATSAARWPARW